MNYLRGKRVASEYYLYCPQTKEAVEVLRRGANGLNTPQGSSKAQFSFMSYHLDKNVSFTLTKLDNIGNQYEDVQFVRSLEELKEEKEFHDEMGGKVTLVLLWEDSAVDDLLRRNIEQHNAIDGYDFPQPRLSGNSVTG